MLFMSQIIVLTLFNNTLHTSNIMHWLANEWRQQDFDRISTSAMAFYNSLRLLEGMTFI
jgi:hypothetical protein